MPELPLLLFPTPEIASRSPGRPGFGNLHMPSLARQGSRLLPKLRQLEEAIFELQDTAAGADPEKVLVIEIIGSVKDFANAVKKIEGFEWLGELEIDEISPDVDFYDNRNPEKGLTGRLYMVMTNQQALRQMLSLWRRYVQDPGMVFELGYAKFKNVFNYLRDIRQWGVQDRIAEGNILEIWREDLQIDERREVTFEAELWFRKSAEKREESERIISGLIEEMGGSIMGRSVISEIAHHSVIGKLPAVAAMEILDRREVELLKCENVMFFRPTGQYISNQEIPEEETDIDNRITYSLPNGDPVIAILDGMPLSNHGLLSGRLIVDDPDNWSSSYQALERQHGTAMASLIVNGDLSVEEKPLRRPVYIRPIMKPVSSLNPPRDENVPEDIILVDYIHSAIVRLMEGNEFEDAVAPTIKVINLSIGDANRQFTRTMSPLARLLDWLSEKYKILFVISAGNHKQDIGLGISTREFEILSNSERESLIVKRIYDDARNRRLLSPAESINGLTVGSHHYDDALWLPVGHVADFFSSNLPSPVSAFGSGYRRSMKPDLLHAGGRVLFRPSFAGPAELSCLRSASAPGNKVATPSSIPGDLGKTKFVCGTSNSAATISRAAGLIYDSLLENISQQNADIDLKGYESILIKAMLVHGCSWAEIGSKLGEIVLPDSGANKCKEWVARWAGYGIPNFDKVLGCTEQRATLIGYGSLKDEQAHVFNMPLPPSLSAYREWRRFTITLAYFSPIAPTTQLYRCANLWFDFEEGGAPRDTLNEKLRVKGIDADSTATARGTLQHEIFEGESAV